ncbi:MAG: M3 family metallopeptidase [Gemmatimonadales bacterium]
MKRKYLMFLMSLAVSLAACSRANPLLDDWDTPFGVPPFHEIENEHYLPAFRAAMAEHDAEIDAIVQDPESATFANTIEALERSGKALSRVSNVFFAIESAHSDSTMREVARTVAPELAAHGDDVTLNRDLYARVKAVYDRRDDLDLSPEQQKLLEETHKRFVRSGVNLDDEDQARLREINGELAELSQTFGQNLLKETNDFEIHVTDTTDLGELPASLVAGAAQEARGSGHESGWSITLQRPSLNPFLQYSPNRELRRQGFVAYAMRGDNDNDADNKDILSRMAALRAERAQLMGYKSHAQFVLSDNMAETPDRVYEFLDQIWRPALRVSKEERDALQQMMREDGAGDDLEGWDWRYYAEKVRKARYDLDEQALRPYFEFAAVRDGAFTVANHLFGLTFTELEDMPKWHEDQQVFEVKDGDGSHLGILYMDFFARESKSGGAWMNDLRAQSRLDEDVKPIVTTNFNFPPPTDDSPSLLSFGESETLFHEFGHAIHGLLSDVTYASLSGTNVPRDFVEFPSQVMENWMGEPEVLRMFAKHYETGEVLPDELIDKIRATATFDQGFATVEYMAASYLDMAWHTLTGPEEHEPRAFEDAEMARIGLIEEIVPRYRSTYFSHIFAGGYSAGYYSYIWAEVLDADAFQAFKETSLFDRETAQRYRVLLSRGGSRPGMELYEEFRGRPPEIRPLLEKRGLTGTE